LGSRCGTTPSKFLITVQPRYFLLLIRNSLFDALLELLGELKALLIPVFWVAIAAEIVPVANIF